MIIKFLIFIDGWYVSSFLLHFCNLNTVRCELIASFALLVNLSLLMDTILTWFLFVLVATTDTAFVLSPHIASSDAGQHNILFSWWSFDFVYLQRTLTSQTWCAGLRNWLLTAPVRYDSSLILRFCVGQTCPNCEFKDFDEEKMGQIVFSLAV